MSGELRQLMPKYIVRGALLRADGTAVGLVGGGAPAWDLMSMASRAQAGKDYHRLLVALDAPIDIYQIDQPPTVTSEIALLMKKQDASNNVMESMVLGEIIEYLTDLAQQSGSRSKQVVWAITTSAGILQKGASISGVFKSSGDNKQGGTAAERTVLATAVEKARRLSAALSYIGGTPQPRLLEAEEISKMFYQLCDPVRAHRYPLAGSMLERVRRVVTTEAEEVHGTA